MTDPNKDLARLLDVLADRGHVRYGREHVSVLEHALQCAALAEREDAAPSLIVAALLHDVGHLVHYLGDDPTGRGIDDRHEHVGAATLARWFDKRVSEPVRLHVPAKRYLCAVDPTYFNTLSAGSRASLELQGGPMTTAEATAFDSLPFADDAKRLRRWDEEAKVLGAVVPPLWHFRFYVDAAIDG